MSLNSKNVFSTHQGIDSDYIESIRLDRKEAKNRLGFNQDEKLVLYTGKVIPQQGEVEAILRLSKKLNDARVIIVGGLEKNVAFYKEWMNEQNITNAQITGYVPPHEVYLYQFAADVLVSFYEIGHPLNRYRSPGKLFEYMASGSPIVSADYPSLREILCHKVNCLLVPPGDEDQLLDSVQYLLDNPSIGYEYANQALKEVTSYTWVKRAERIIKQTGIPANFK